MLQTAIQRVRRRRFSGSVDGVPGQPSGLYASAGQRFGPPLAGTSLKLPPRTLGNLYVGRRLFFAAAEFELSFADLFEHLGLSGEAFSLVIVGELVSGFARYPLKRELLILFEVHLHSLLTFAQFEVHFIREHRTSPTCSQRDTVTV